MSPPDPSWRAKTYGNIDDRALLLQRGVKRPINFLFAGGPSPLGRANVRGMTE